MFSVSRVRPQSIADSRRSVASALSRSSSGSVRATTRCFACSSSHCSADAFASRCVEAIESTTVPSYVSLNACGFTQLMYSGVIFHLPSFESQNPSFERFHRITPMFTL